MISFVDEIDYQNFILAGESITDEEKLLSMPAGDYYARINVFIHQAREREKNQQEE